jgi:hypothetical protein
MMAANEHLIMVEGSPAMAAEGLKPAPFDHQKCWFLGGNVSISRVARSKKVLVGAMFEVQIGLTGVCGTLKRVGHIIFEFGFFVFGQVAIATSPQ